MLERSIFIVKIVHDSENTPSCIAIATRLKFDNMIVEEVEYEQKEDLEPLKPEDE